MTSAPNETRRSDVVFVVDDDVDMAAFMAEALESNGMVPRIVTGGRELLSILRHETPLTILLDVVMPDMDGIEVIQAIGRTGCQAPVVIVSGSSKQLLTMAEILGSTCGAVVVGTLQKPFSVDELLSVLSPFGRNACVEGGDETS